MGTAATENYEGISGAVQLVAMQVARLIDGGPLAVAYCCILDRAKRMGSKHCGDLPGFFLHLTT